MTVYDTLANDIGKILPKLPTDKRQKHGAILTTILGSIASKVIGLAMKEYQVSFTTRGIKPYTKL